MTQQQQWPQDERFRKFAARLADAVTVYINNGGRIGCFSSMYECRCPLGTGSERSHPGMTVAAEAWGIDLLQADAFITGFDSQNGIPESAYGRLGSEYRRRFVTGEK